VVEVAGEGEEKKQEQPEMKTGKYAASIQSFMRMVREREKFETKQESAVALQSTMRMALAKRRVSEVQLEQRRASEVHDAGTPYDEVTAAAPAAEVAAPAAEVAAPAEQVTAQGLTTAASRLLASEITITEGSTHERNQEVPVVPDVEGACSKPSPSELDGSEPAGEAGDGAKKSKRRRHHWYPAATLVERFMRPKLDAERPEMPAATSQPPGGGMVTKDMGARVDRDAITAGGNERSAQEVPVLVPVLQSPTGREASTPDRSADKDELDEPAVEASDEGKKGRGRRSQWRAATSVSRFMKAPRR
jgi:hypothetical protein